MHKLTYDQQLLDLHLAAYHEAGHKIIYNRFGGDGDGKVWENTSGNPDEHTWRGQFRPRTCPQVMHDCAKRSGLPAADLPDNWRALFGMAGMVAEEIMLDNADDLRLLSKAISLRIWHGGASQSDLESMGIAITEDYIKLNIEAVAKTRRLLLENWSLVQREAEYLILEAIEGTSGKTVAPKQLHRPSAPGIQVKANSETQPPFSQSTLPRPQSRKNHVARE
jgi:hypothetical protein